MGEDFFIPFAMFGAAVLIVFFALQAQHKRRELEHKQRMLALEKGLPVPPSFIAEKPKAHNPYAAPFVWIAIGFGLLIISCPIGKPQISCFASIPLFIFFALLIPVVAFLLITLFFFMPLDGKFTILGCEISTTENVTNFDNDETSIANLPAAVISTISSKTQ